MTNRIIDIQDTGAFIHYSNQLLVIKKRDNEESTVPVEEIGVLILANPAATITQQAIAAVCHAKGMVVICGTNHHPAGMFMPVSMHSNSAKNIELQAAVTLPLKKRLWQTIVQAKIRFQSQLLFSQYKDDQGIGKLASGVKSGDPENREAQAAQKYWHLIFADKDFRRNRDGEDQNRFLNYGYTVLRACTARAVCAAGLHPSFGLHHHNQYNPFRLADDIMEPFRPLVDRKVIEILLNNEKTVPFNKELRQKLLEIITDTIMLEGENVSIFQALIRCAVSLLHVYEKKTKSLVLPDSLLFE